MNKLDPINNKDDFNDLVEFISNPIHQSKRVGVKNSHLKYRSHFTTYSHVEFMSFITNRYLEYRRLGTVPSAAYTFSIIQTIQNEIPDLPFNKRIKKSDVFKIFHNLNKMYNVENRDKVFYTSEGKEFQIVGTSAGFSKKNVNVPMYSDEEFQIVDHHFDLHLSNFIESNKKSPDHHDELSLLISFLTSGPYRFSEVNSLTIEKAEQLVLTCVTRIKSKSGSGSVDMVIPVLFSNKLNGYMKKLPRHVINKKSAPLFTIDYNKAYRMYKSEYSTIFGKSIVGKRVFHGFRNHFAEKAGKVDRDLAQRSMNHTSSGMTSHYINRQKKHNQRENVLELVNKMYIEKRFNQ